MEPSSPVLLKRARPPGGGNQEPLCLVDGCTADLGKCRDYHRRHKVCEVHSKTPQVTIRGQEQRFCQQCSRFHSLVEFDERKRSCRKRLDGHNRRRRKPRHSSLSVNTGSCLSNLQGSRHIQFGSHQLFAPAALTSSCSVTVKEETDQSSEPKFNFGNRISFFHGSLPHNYGEEHFSFIQSNSLHPGVSISQPILDAIPSSSNGGCSRTMFSNLLNQAIDSDSAHSLLSLQPAEVREIGLSPMVQSVPTSSLIPNLQFSSQAMEGEQVGSLLISATDDGSNTNHHENQVFQTGQPGSLSATGTHQTLSSS